MANRKPKAANVTAEDVIEQAARQAPANESPAQEADADELPIPTYETEEEVAAALGLYGDSYDKLIAAGQINAPTRAELRERGHPNAPTAKRGQKTTAKRSTKRT